MIDTCTRIVRLALEHTHRPPKFDSKFTEGKIMVWENTPSGFWTLVTWVLSVMIPLAYLGFGTDILKMGRSGTKKMRKAEEEGDPPAGEQAKRGGKALMNVLLSIGIFLALQIFLVPGRYNLAGVVISGINFFARLITGQDVITTVGSVLWILVF